MKQNNTTSRLKSLHEAMEILTVDLNNEIKTLLNNIEEIVIAVYMDEIENLAVLVSGFQAPFYNDQAVINLYKQHLVRYFILSMSAKIVSMEKNSVYMRNNLQNTNLNDSRCSSQAHSNEKGNNLIKRKKS